VTAQTTGVSLAPSIQTSLLPRLASVPMPMPVAYRGNFHGLPLQLKTPEQSAAAPARVYQKFRPLPSRPRSRPRSGYQVVTTKWCRYHDLLSYPHRCRYLLRVRVELPAEGLDESGSVPTRWDGRLVALQEFDAHGNVLRERPVLYRRER
jgi:hypothetical protein